LLVLVFESGVPMTDFKHILCPIDFSDASKHALQHSVAVASWFKARVTGLHVTRQEFVFEPPILFAERGGLKALPADRDQLFVRLNDFMQPAVGARVPWNARIEEGVPGERVLDCARSLPADLIVMGTHGRSGFEHLVLGSVTEKVLRNAGCPVMTVPPRAATASRLPFKRLLCAVDFSDASIEGLHVALSLAEEADADLTVMNVIDSPDDETFLVEAFESADMQKQLEAQAAGRLDALVPDEAAVWCRPSTKVVVGAPHREIVTVANDLMADLIVVGVHGRNVVDLALFGSTTNQVVRRASCPVLTIRAKQ
jgi:nucleotide-binding universal stress UspA family protein